MADITVKNLHEFGPQVTTCVADPILDEDGQPILDESGNNLCPETVANVTKGPSEHSNIALWLHARDISNLFTVQGTQPWGAGAGPVTADGQTVGSWLDLSGNDHHLNHSQGNHEPTYKTNIINGMSVIRGIDAVVDDCLYSTESVLTQDANVIIFSVSKSSNNERLGILFHTRNGAGTAISHYSDTRDATRYGSSFRDSSGNNYAILPSDIGTNPVIKTTIITNGTITERLNGVAGATTAISGDQITLNNYTVIFAGDANATLSPFYGDIAELVVVDGTFTEDDIIGMELFLNDIYAVY